jgi:translocation and assembly module TamA
MRPRRPAIACGLAAALVLAACAGNGDQPLDANGEPFPTLPPVPYEVTFPPDLPPDLARLLPEVSESRRGTAEPPSSRLAIRQRAERDVELLQQALRAEGYFDGRVGFRIEDPAAVPAEGLVEELGRAAQPPQAILVFEIEPGPRYRFDDLEVVLPDNPDAYAAPTPASLGLVAGEPARTQAVLDAEQKLLADARRAGFALARLGQREAIVDHARRVMDVTLRLEPGQRARFGQVTFTGAEGIDEAFLRGRLPFAAGERFDPELLEKGQRDLFDTDLFSTIIVQPAGQLTPDRRLDVTYELRQRPPRSIGASLGYQTDQGLNATLFWEHRNFFGAGERLRAETAVSEPQQTASLSFTKPDFLAPRQSLLANTTLQREDREAYKSTSAGAGLGLQREITENLDGSLGVAFRYAAIEEEDEPENVFGLLSLPARLAWDFANDRFDPTRGGTLVLTAAPFTDLLGPSRNFFKSRLTHTRYLQLLEAPQLVLALRGSVGTLFGVSREEVPADERFYAGGGGSIRGIAFQLAGPLDDDDKPLGGRSLLEGSVELRTRLANDMGAVLFLDAGTVYGSAVPDGSEDLLFGVGPGFRYYTPIGPVRVDLGFPLNPRKGVDDSFQLYLSIGQAF